MMELQYEEKFYVSRTNYGSGDIEANILPLTKEKYLEIKSIIEDEEVIGFVDSLNEYLYHCYIVRQKAEIITEQIKDDKNKGLFAFSEVNGDFSDFINRFGNFKNFYLRMSNNPKLANHLHENKLTDDSDYALLCSLRDNQDHHHISISIATFDYIEGKATGWFASIDNLLKADERAGINHKKVLKGNLKNELLKMKDQGEYKIDLLQLLDRFKDKYPGLFRYFFKAFYTDEVRNKLILLQQTIDYCLGEFDRGTLVYENGPDLNSQLILPRFINLKERYRDIFDEEMGLGHLS